jgi:hypothetical protein
VDALAETNQQLGQQLLEQQSLLKGCRAEKEQLQGNLAVLQKEYAELVDSVAKERLELGQLRAERRTSRRDLKKLLGENSALKAEREGLEE